MMRYMMRWVGMRYMYMYLKFIQGLEIHPGRK